MDLLYGDLEAAAASEEEQLQSSRESRPETNVDPLHGETFSLASLMTRRRGADGQLPARKLAISEFSSTGGVSENYVQRSSVVFFGPPPPHSLAPHNADCVVVLSRLSRGVSDADIRKAASEIFGPVRIVRVLVDDPATGISAGVAIVEFFEAASASKATATGSLLGGLVRKLSRREFDKVACGSFPVLDYGPASADLLVSLKN